jgi:hypothetical protein
MTIGSYTYDTALTTNLEKQHNVDNGQLVEKSLATWR